MGIIKKHSEQFDYLAVWIGRVGFVARGFVWACVGGVAASAGFTAGERPEDATGAMEVVASNTGGAVVLIFLSIGLLSYTTWRWFEGFYGLSADPNATKFSRIINGYVTPFASGAAYLIYAVVTLNDVVNGLSSENKDPNRCGTICKIASNVAGSLFLTLAGIILFGVAIGWLFKLIKAHGRPISSLDQQKLRKLPQPAVFAIYAIGAVGLFGRAILFSLLSALVIRVAWDSSVRNAGFGAALASLQVSAGGKGFLVCVGVLLVIFGLFSVIQSRYKEFLPYKPHLLPTDVQAKVDAKVEDLKDKAANQLPFATHTPAPNTDAPAVPPV